MGSMGSTWTGWAALSRVAKKKEMETHTHKLGPGPQGSKIPDQVLLQGALINVFRVGWIL